MTEFRETETLKSVLKTPKLNFIISSLGKIQRWTLTQI